MIYLFCCENIYITLMIIMIYLLYIYSLIKAYVKNN